MASRSCKPGYQSSSALQYDDPRLVEVNTIICSHNNTKKKQDIVGILYFAFIKLVKTVRSRPIQRLNHAYQH